MQGRNKSNEPDKEEESNANGEIAEPTALTPGALSPRLEDSPPAAAAWSSQQEKQAQEEYENEMAEHYLYELVRRFASAARRSALYDCKACLKELEQLPVAHQRSTSVLIMVGKMTYEQQDYAAVGTLIFLAAPLIADSWIRTCSQREHSEVLASSNHIVCGIWKSTPRCCGTCNGVTSYRISRKSS